jgi:5-methyltetrahydrofolate--homocysteine methyltransferase
MSFDRQARIKWLKQEAQKRILLLDGSWGVMIQGYGLKEDDFRGQRFCNHNHELKGNIDILSLTQPEIIREVGHAYLSAGADILETNTFTTAASSQADYGLSSFVREMCETSARLARKLCDEATTDDRPRLVAGVLSPTNRTASISPNVNDSAFRNIGFDELRETYRDAARGLIAGGSDLLMIETIFDTLNAKAAIFAIEEVFEELGERLPIWISGTITDLSGRTLTGRQRKRSALGAPRQTVRGRPVVRSVKGRVLRRRLS